MSHDRANTVIPRVPMPPVSGRARARRILRAGLGVMVVAVVASLSSTAYAAGSTVDVATSATFGTVLTASQGFALYTFPSDHNGMSACTGSCVAVWPALTVPAGTTPTAGAGVPGAVASVLQTNGTYQVTYNDAPLYTFVGDTAPGQVSGNNAHHIGSRRHDRVDLAVDTDEPPGLDHADDARGDLGDHSDPGAGHRGRLRHVIRVGTVLGSGSGCVERSHVLGVHRARAGADVDGDRGGRAGGDQRHDVVASWRPQPTAPRSARPGVARRRVAPRSLSFSPPRAAGAPLCVAAHSALWLWGGLVDAGA